MAERTVVSEVLAQHQMRTNNRTARTMCSCGTEPDERGPRGTFGQWLRGHQADAVLTALAAARAGEGEHGPDWSDWRDDHPEEGPSCRCGFNGSPEECAEWRAAQRGGEVEARGINRGGRRMADHDESCESEFIEGPYAWTPCCCDERAREALAEVIWNASRADEGTISATGANHVAAAVLAHLAARGGTAPMEERTEHRAVWTNPYYESTDEPEQRTEWRSDKSLYDRYPFSRSEETWAKLLRWERRQVLVGPVEVEDEH